MLHTKTTANERRRQFRSGLASGQLLRLPGAFNALSAVLIEQMGFEGVYLSGAVMSASLVLPDIGLTTLSEITSRGQEITRITALPTLIDADTGFGEPLNVARTIQSLEDAGLSGCHIEDQINPKRCGHLEGKSIVSTNEMVRRIAAAADARRDADFVICARSDARAIEGLDATIERAKAYVDAGADMLFPEALTDVREFEKFRAAFDLPVMANMTEFGRSELLDTKTLHAIGINLVIYPVTLLRIAMGAAERALATIAREGTQGSLIGEMQTRDRLYELLDYERYTEFDQSILERGGESDG